MRPADLAALVFFVSLLAACRYVDHPTRDPVEPTMLAVTNLTPDTVYLEVGEGTSPLGAGLAIQSRAGEELRTVLRCNESLCSDGCDVAPCAAVPSSVRALLANETATFWWNDFHFTAGTQTCPLPPIDRECLIPTPASDGRYLVTVCYGRGFVGRGGPLLRDANEPRVIRNAALADVTCAAALDFGVPSHDVRYQVYLRQ